MRNGVAMKVVIADDDVLSQIMLQGAVEQLGHDCVTASDGAEAWERITSAQPDVLITDLMMPGINGFELCRRVRNLDSDRYIYIIIATSLGAQGDVRDGIEAGADDFLTKPIDPFDLEMSHPGFDAVLIPWLGGCGDRRLSSWHVHRSTQPSSGAGPSRKFWIASGR